MGEGDLDIRTLETAGDMAAIGTVFQQIWGTTTPIVATDILMALSHAGGYVAGAFDSGHAVGASFGFLAEHEGERALYSHVTGILPGLRHGGVGRAMKQHQRAWAAERGIAWIVWTFDPLVRRNAWFNIEVIGAQVVSYLVNFLGTTNDAHGDDESDRLVVAWPTSDAVERPRPSGEVETTRIDTPDDIFVLRRTDPAAAAEWRLRLRDELAPLLGAGGMVTGFTRDGAYVVDTPVS